MKKQDHRAYVGGNWDTAGKKQFDFLVEEGLKPYHNFLDIGCGCFRAGKYFIEYLKPWRYYGIDRNKWLLDAGFEELISINLDDRKFIALADENFSFDKFPITPNFDYVLAKSVFTHLTKDKIKQCLTNLKKVISPVGVFYASITGGKSEENPKESHDTKVFRYSINEIRELADGWKVEDIGRRGTHKQKMLKLTLV